MSKYLANKSRYDLMNYRRCGNSGLLLPVISLGLWQNCTDLNFVRDIVINCFDQGLTHFDLANNYGPPAGKAEEVFGKIISNELNHYRDELIISTKAGYDMWDGPYGDWGSRKYLIASIDQSLKRMKLEYFDIFYHHRPDMNTPLEETIGALSDIVKSGKAIYAGISNYFGDRIIEAKDIANQLFLPLIVNQVKYNMFDREAEDNVLRQCSSTGQGVIAFCPLSQGLLTDKYLNGIPSNSRAASNNNLSGKLNKEYFYKINNLNDFSKKRGQSLAELALTWLLRHQDLASVIIGVSSLEQLKINFKASKAPLLSNEELNKIDQILLE